MGRRGEKRGRWGGEKRERWGGKGEGGGRGEGEGKAGRRGRVGERRAGRREEKQKGISQGRVLPSLLHAGRSSGWFTGLGCSIETLKQQEVMVQ